jgi:murein DD-endopeptidase MepM/ murein hydrolase activator NlpD
VIIRHGAGLLSVYAHNRRNLVAEGARVAKGDIVGEVGETGRASSPHLHFEIRKDNVAQDPLYYLQQ